MFVAGLFALEVIMTDQEQDMRSQLDLLELCSDALIRDYPISDLYLLGGDTVVELWGIGGVDFRNREDGRMALPIRYAVVATSEQLREAGIDLADLKLFLKKLPEDEFTCEHGTVPVSVLNTGVITPASVEDKLAELRTQISFVLSADEIL
jgi:hypothetical protein